MDSFTQMLIGIIAETQKALGFSDNDVATANGSAEIVAEIKQLRKSAEDNAKRNVTAIGKINEFHSRIAALEAENAELRRDRDRLNYIQSRACYLFGLDTSDIRKSIDAAMSEQPAAKLEGCEECLSPWPDAHAGDCRVATGMKPAAKGE